MKLINLECPTCKTMFDIPKKSHIYQSKKGKEKFFCSIKCSRIKHVKIDKKCLTCEKVFMSSTNPKSNKCCSRRCASIFSQKHIDVEKTRQSVLDYHVKQGTIAVLEIRNCCFCKNLFDVNKKSNKRFCSRSCARKNNFLDDNFKKRSVERLKNRRNDMIKNGTWNVWKSRCEPSYPEKYFMEVLKNKNLKYEFNYSFGIYNIDFAFVENKIALEIDGQQHLKPERIESDARKDKLLIDNGWIVFRIPWKNPNSKSGKQFLLEKINEFVDFYDKRSSSLLVEGTIST